MSVSPKTYVEEIESSLASGVIVSDVLYVFPDRGRERSDRCKFLLDSSFYFKKYINNN